MRQQKHACIRKENNCRRKTKTHADEKELTVDEKDTHIQTQKTTCIRKKKHLHTKEIHM